MNANCILSTLYAFLYLIPNCITKTDFFKAALPRLLNEEFADTKQRPSKNQFIQICFYMGLDKKFFNFGAAMHKQLEAFLVNYLDEHLDSLNVMDLSLIASAAFKTATVIPSQGYNQRLCQEICKLPQNLQGQDAILVTLIKSLRLQRHQSEEVCKYLEQVISTETIQQLQTTGLVHIYAYFAENLWNNPEIINTIKNEFMQRLPTVSNNAFATNNNWLRPKDLAIFLWCCAHLNGQLSNSQFQQIETILLEKLRKNEYVHFVDQLVDSCLSLWILNYKSKYLLDAAINLKESQPPKNIKQPKVDSRLLVLQSAAGIEKPEWLTPPETPYDFESSLPSYLAKSNIHLTQMAKQLSLEENICSAKVICPIVGINIPSIMVEYQTTAAVKSIVFVDILNEQQILKYNQEPVGLIKLKHRLLQALGHKTIVVSPYKFKFK